MKKHYLLIATLLLSVKVLGQGFFEQVPYRGAFGAEDWSKPWANWSPATTKYPGDQGYVAPEGLPAAPVKVEITADINPGEGKEVLWTNDNYYELSGGIKVLSGTLKIQEGTIIRGKATDVAADKAFLLVTKGAKIYAVGTPEKPIVFTSGEEAVATGEEPLRARGDWGGLLIFGKGKINHPDGTRQYEALPAAQYPEASYGGGSNADDNDSSGALKYVRVEFAGNNPTGLNNSEINGITFASIGRRTQADYLQVSYSQDDSYEWFGGTSSHKHLIAFAGQDDDFDADEGYRGKIQFALAVKHPLIHEPGSNASNGLELDNNTGLNTASQVVPGNPNPSPVTNIIFSNITLVGPLLSGAANSSLSALAQTNFGNAALIRTNNSSSIFNAIITGYKNPLFNLNHPTASITPSVQTKANQDSITVRNTVFGYTTSNSRFVTSNSPVADWSVKNWIVAGPASGTTGVTENDTTATTIDFKSGAYTGAANGEGDVVSFANVDYSLASGSNYLTGASFAHPKLADNLITGLNDASEANLNIVASPNPFSESTTISYSVVNTGNVNITVYDLTGNKITELVNGNASGTNTVDFNASVLPKGVYMTKAVLGNAVKTLKLIVK